MGIVIFRYSRERDGALRHIQQGVNAQLMWRGRKRRRKRRGRMDEDEQVL